MKADFSEQELKLFIKRMDQLEANDQLVIGGKDMEGQRYDVEIEVCIGVRPSDGKQAIILDVQLKRKA